MADFGWKIPSVLQNLPETARRSLTLLHKLPASRLHLWLDLLRGLKLSLPPLAPTPFLSQVFLLIRSLHI